MGKKCSTGSLDTPRQAQMHASLNYSGSRVKCAGMKHLAIAMGIVTSLAVGLASAEVFGPVAYDAKSDELVVTITYSGTNPDHIFSLAWNRCTTHPDGTTDVQAEVIDSQARDAVSRDFTKTVRLSLVGLICRPATVTLHSWPNSFTTVQVPRQSR